ncbi:hypothetical protein [Noviherbaspirillum sedimenti]|nr:hypothetical protein [Noviherbaspirillum sedimenti]
MTTTTRFTLTVLMSACAIGAHAQSRGPAAQYWVDLSTTNTSLPGMSGGGLLGSIIGASMGGGSGKTLDAELQVRAHPSGVEASHAIPAGLDMGASLPLLPVRPAGAGRGSDRHEAGDQEKPKGRILLYWGCGDNIRPGQPKVLDLAKQNYGEFTQFFGSRGGYSKGVQHKPGNSVWPNERDSKRVPENASLQGEHAVAGDGVPASLKFSVGAANDFLPPVRLSSKGAPKDGVRLEWQAMQHAQAYFLHAQGGAKGANGADDMIFWSSSEKPDNGWSLMSYQSPAQIANLLQQKVVLSPSTVNCTVPKGIFDKADGAMLNMIAYGPELNLAHPPRPAKAPAGWQPEWTARVRIKSTGMTMLGMEGGAGEESAGQRDNATETPNPINLLKGIFSR